ncbi:hypothetical protein X798_04565 [Onchocerca flexuosa]|uniref:Uncharacterized protein n=1 Tax=Onchocerca flexuosa TaxID=387005 RepID=A0A238BUI8_9BILA|nr:hypothetical protein X798_04565 [Onchocerca flexuosa]
MSFVHSGKIRSSGRSIDGYYSDENEVLLHKQLYKRNDSEAMRCRTQVDDVSLSSSSFPFSIDTHNCHPDSPSSIFI